MTDSGLAGRIASVRAGVEQAARAAGRDPSEVTLVGVSKTVGREVVDAAWSLGLRHFGENRVMDCRDKYATPLPPGSMLHLIGQLQTNKAAVAVDLFDLIESVDRGSLVQELEKQGAKRERKVPILLQVNVAREEQKSGCEPEDVDQLVEQILGSPHLSLEGLMTIAPLAESAEAVRPVFRGLRETRDRLRATYPGLALAILSMGMSNDYGVAIEEGATHVRVGRALFEG